MNMKATKTARGNPSHWCEKSKKKFCELSKLDNISWRRTPAYREYPSTRRSSFSIKRVDPKKCENWTCIGSHDQFFQHFKYGIEIRIESVNKDNSHSWVRISCGTIRHVNDYIKHDTENPADPQEEESPQWLQSDQRQKQNLNRENLQGRQQPYQYTKKDVMTLNNQNKILLRAISQRKWSIFAR